MFGGPIGSTRSRLVPPGLQHAGSMFDPRDQTVHPLTSELFTKTVWWLGRRSVSSMEGDQLSAAWTMVPLVSLSPFECIDWAKYIHVISAGFEPMIERVRHGHRL